MYEVFEKLLKEFNVTTYQVAKATGISTASFTAWKQGKWNLKTDKLQKIADFFGVTVDYLITGNESPESDKAKLTSKDEKDIAKRLQDTLKELENGQTALAFSGEPLDDETRELLKISLENSLRIAKINAKNKFTPKKYRK